MTFVAENELEESLMKAATQPEHRAQFVKDLLAAKLVLLDERSAEQRAQGRGVLEDGGRKPAWLRSPT